MKLLDKKPLLVLAASACFGLSQTASAALSYSNDFESYTTGDIAGFSIGNIVNGGAGWFAGTPAPGDYNNGYSAIVNEGGVAQGSQQISVFNDYNAWSPFGDGMSNVTIQAFVSTDVGAITADMVGNTYNFTFDAKLGNIEAPSQAEAFVKVLKSSDASYIELANNVFDSDANLTTDWSGGSISLLVDAGMVGELLQLGFNNTATDYDPSAVYYDNLNFSTAVPVPAAAWLFGSALVGLAGIGRKRKA
jgi:hypothetical protein